MTPLASCSAPVASPDTPALCLDLLSRTSRLVPGLFIVTPPGPGHGRRRPLLPTAPWTAAFPPLISFDHSP